MTVKGDAKNTLKFEPLLVQSSPTPLLKALIINAIFHQDSAKQMERGREKQLQTSNLSLFIFSFPRNSLEFVNTEVLKPSNNKATHVPCNHGSNTAITLLKV